MLEIQDATLSCDVTCVLMVSFCHTPLYGVGKQRGAVMHISALKMENSVFMVTFGIIYIFILLCACIETSGRESSSSSETPLREQK